MTTPTPSPVASPGLSPEEHVRIVRFQAVVQAAARIMGMGLHVFCPIAHTHPIAQAGKLPTGWEFWESYDRAMLAACAELWVVKMSGWDQSVGVRHEIEIAHELGLRVRFLDHPVTEEIVHQVLAKLTTEG
jgi:hypothetical protein